MALWAPTVSVIMECWNDRLQSARLKTYIYVTRILDFIIFLLFIGDEYSYYTLGQAMQ